MREQGRKLLHEIAQKRPYEILINISASLYVFYTPIKNISISCPFFQ